MKIKDLPIFLKVKIRDGFTCRLCGDWKGKIYPETGAIVKDIHAHHITPKAQDGPDYMENLITLCDLCHGVVTPNWWKWFGINKIENGKEKMQELKEIYDEYLQSVYRKEQKISNNETFLICRYQHLGYIKTASQFVP